MFLQIIITGVTLGLVSSLHCIGMCGPLALALPLYHLPKSQQLFALFLYNTGRIITYSFMGLLFGLAGRTFYLAGLQRWFSIGAGIVVLLLIIQYYYHKIFPQPGWITFFHQKVQVWIGRFLRSPRLINYLFIGMANGLLPCGMVYMAVAVSLSFSLVTESILLMSFFGFGTWPAMLLLSLFGVRIPFSFRQKMTKIIPVFFTGMAILLLLRGLNLGIPFISPVIETVHGKVVPCP